MYLIQPKNRVVYETLELLIYPRNTSTLLRIELDTYTMCVSGGIHTIHFMVHGSYIDLLFSGGNKNNIFRLIE